MRKNKTILGRQYKHKRSAVRAIHRFQVRYFVSIPKHFQFFIEPLMDGQFQVSGKQF